MSLIQMMRDKWKRRQVLKTVGEAPATASESAPPVIETQWGQVSESARHQAALNMRADPELRAEIERMLAQQLFEGDLERGVAESKRRYPEAYKA